MLPTHRADQIFPSASTDYTVHLGSHQAEAFTLLWQLHDAPDPLSNSDGAAWHLNQALKAPADNKIAPMDVQQELFGALQKVEARFGNGAAAIDIEFASLFHVIANWQHDDIVDRVVGFTHYLYE